MHETYRTELVAGAVESTFNWYWLVDRADNLALLRSKVRADCLDFARNATYEVG